MSLPKEFHSLENVRRAWRWVLSNPDRAYKKYFREIYAAYAVADDRLLTHLSERLRRGIYEPETACKIYLPKKSGILRPLSLLCVEDQIAYQAAVNVCAEHLYPRVRNRYLQQVFGHLYAGKSSTWFYRKWADGYRAFNRAATNAFKGGYRFTASFDLTACYDSIDHKVLSHFMEDIGLTREFCSLLASWLSYWTATEKKIFHGHGIPQGPIGSGLVAEVVLRHFDDHSWPSTGVQYFRYVDDIRLFARSEPSLRRALIRLDHLSKDVGLFPQSSKIDIHEVSDIRAELKSVSQPVEQALRSKSMDQARVRARLLQLSPRLTVTDPTRFKFVLAHAVPTAPLTARLWRLYQKSPEYYEPIARYLSRYNQIPKGAAQPLFKAVVSQSLYQSIAAEFIRVCQGRLSAQMIAVGRRRFKPIWKPRVNQADLAAALGRWLISIGHLTDAQLEYALRPSAVGWMKAQLLLEIALSKIDDGVRRRLLAGRVRDRSFDTALCAAYAAGSNGFKLNVAARAMSPAAAIVLREFGLIRRGGQRVCGITASLLKLINQDSSIDWRRLLGPHYRPAERQMVECRGYAETNATAWVNALDVFNDYVFDRVFHLDGTIGAWTLGRPGSVLNSDAKRFAAKYPRCFAYAKETHERRLESSLSHPKVRSTGRATMAIHFSYTKRSRRLLREAVLELETAGLV